MTDTQVENEIAKLKDSKYVKLAKKEEALKCRRRQYLYTLRTYDKKGRKLAADGVTLESLEKMYEL